MHLVQAIAFLDAEGAVGSHQVIYGISRRFLTGVALCRAFYYAPAVQCGSSLQISTR